MYHLWSHSKAITRSTFCPANVHTANLQRMIFANSYPHDAVYTPGDCDINNQIAKICYLHAPSTLLQRSFHHCVSNFLPLVIKMPALSPTMTEGNIIKWNKAVGEQVTTGEMLCEIQTDKAAISLENEEDGILAKIVREEGSGSIPVGSVIALIAEEGEDWQNIEIPTALDYQSNASELEASPKMANVEASSHTSSSDALGPAVRSLLSLYNLSASEIKPSGRNDRLLKGDVLEFISTKNLKTKTSQEVKLKEDVNHNLPKKAESSKSVPSPKMPTPKGGFTDLPVTNIRSVIATRLTESKTTIPHSYMTIDCCINDLLELRQQLKASGRGLSVNDFIVKAAALALHSLDAVNSIYDGKEVLKQKFVDVSIAVATENGLITPIIHDAVNKTVDEISSITRDLASRARVGKLALKEFQGGSFTISNLGMFGIDEFSAVINPPQACILAVGRSRSCLNLQAKKETRMMVTLSSDVRVVDDALAAEFMAEFQRFMESPINLIGVDHHYQKMNNVAR